jgi:hypothetical protein
MLAGMSDRSYRYVLQRTMLGWSLTIGRGTYVLYRLEGDLVEWRMVPQAAYTGQLYSCIVRNRESQHRARRCASNKVQSGARER